MKITHSAAIYNSLDSWNFLIICRTAKGLHKSDVHIDYIYAH